MIEIIRQALSLLLLAMLVFNMTQRSHQAHGEKKRYATLYIALVILVSLVMTVIIHQFGLSGYYLFFVLAAAACLVWYLRSRICVFGFRCSGCGRFLPAMQVLYHDEPECTRCGALSSEVNRGAEVSVPMRVADIDWETWTPLETAVLCFIRDGDRVLLIHKKTGLGAGKINAPGGRIEPGESPEQAAVRETEEETGIVPHFLKELVLLHFQFLDGYRLKGHVFLATGYNGTMINTPEADPFWCDIDKIPFKDMWADDILWIPGMLEGRTLAGWFVFDGDRMTDYRMENSSGE